MSGGAAKARRANNPYVVWLGTALLIAFGIALIASLVNLWPSIDRATTSPAKAVGEQLGTVRLFFGVVPVKVTASTSLLLLVVLTGALGSVVHAATSLGDFVGNRRFYVSWSAWYLLRPVVGAALATLLYFAFRGGFLNDNSPSSSINPYGIATLAGLAGLFSKEASDKLKEVFKTLFHVSSTAGDAQREDDLANLLPVLHAVEPDHVTAGATNLTLTLHGEHFVAGATTARIDGIAHTSAVVSEQKLTVKVPDELVTAPGRLLLTVFTGPPGGGESRGYPVPIL